MLSVTTDPDTRKAMADQRADMIAQADDLTSRAAVLVGIGYPGTAKLWRAKADGLRANAERLAERSGLQPAKG